MISTSIFICLLVSVIISVITFYFSELIASEFFNDLGLVIPLRIFSFAIPFLTLINVIVSIFRGFDRVKQTVIFHQILWNSLFPIFLVGIVFFDNKFINIFYAYIASIIITCLILIIYSIKFLYRMQYSPRRLLRFKLNKELLIFSFPLLGTSVLNMLLSWTDTLMLGGIKSSYDVGLYNGVLPLASFIMFPLTALLTIFMPIYSGLFAKKAFNEIKRNYSIITKWLCLITFPIFLLLFLYPDQLINYILGPSYTVAANALRILAFGFIIGNFLGPNGATLLAMGKSFFILIATLTATILNIALNLTLIPSYGITGAAFASSFSMISVNFLKGIKLYSSGRVQPFSKNLVKPTILTLVIIIIIYLILDNFYIVEIWLIPVLFIIYYIVYFAAILFTKSIDKEDLKMLELIEHKTGFKSRFIKKIINRFL